MTTTNSPSTIDNLGVDASKQYALNQKELARHIREDLRETLPNTAISVITPAKLSDFESKFAIGLVAIWAAFAEPKAFAASSARLFTIMLVPSLGSREVLMDQLERFVAAAPSDPFLLKQHKVLQNLLDCLVKEEKTFSEIDGRRRQYQKG